MAKTIKKFAKAATNYFLSSNNTSGSKNYINILLLGETGVGKSTFINSVANYLTCGDFESINPADLIVLIPSTFDITDKSGNKHKVSLGKQDKNEFQEVGESATQNVKTYVFPISNNVNIRLIDTPGMGDTRGIEQDDINCDNILDYIANIDELHAICVLFRPDKSRSTVFFQYCIAQIFSRLDKSAANNIIFVFTGTRGSDYSPGETKLILQKTIDDIHKRSPQVQIPMDRNIFCFENESFKYLAGLKDNIKFDKYIRKNCIMSWNKSVKECWR